MARKSKKLKRTTAPEVAKDEPEIDPNNPTLVKIHIQQGDPLSALTVSRRQPNSDEDEDDDEEEDQEPVDNSQFFSQLISPLAVEDFKSSILHHKAVAILGGGADRIQPLLDEFFDGGDVRSLLESTASDAISVWLPSASSSTSSSSSTVDSFKTSEAAFAQRLYESNQASLYFRGSEDTCETLTRAVLAGLDWPLGVDHSSSTSRGEVEIFLGNTRNATPTHTDFQHNFTIQLAGSKKWRFKRGDLANPLAAKSTHFANTPDGAKEIQLLLSQVCGGSVDLVPPSSSSCDDEGWEEVELHAGDVMYHPPGMWHNVATTSEHSLSCNISLVSPSWADIVANSVRQLLWRDAFFRRPVCAADLPMVQEMLMVEEKAGLLKDVAKGLGVLNSMFAELDWSEEQEESSKFGSTTLFQVNPLAVVMFDTDAFLTEDSDDEEDEEINCIVSVNIGASSPQGIEAMSRCQVSGIPRALLPVLTKLRPLRRRRQSEWTGADLDAMCVDASVDWKHLVHVLMRAGWLLQRWQ